MSKTGGARVRARLVLLAIAAIACVRTGRATPAPPRWSADLAAPRIGGDTGTTDTIATGALHRSYLVRQGPWAVHVLDVDLARCWTPVAVKGHPGASGRTKTSALTASLLGKDFLKVGGGVNADFFLFDPPGVPTGAHVSNGEVVTGPGARPVFAIDTAGRPWIGVLSTRGVAISGPDSLPIVSWNRLSADGLAWFDGRYGPAVDTSTGSLRVALDTRGGIHAIDTGATVTTIPSSGGVLVLGPRAAASVRQRLLLAARSRSRFVVSVRLLPLLPREAVGGFPILVQDSMEVPGLDSAGAATFAPVRHPRTIVGVASGGRRLLLITIDGRQPGHSVGTTNRESARVALELGATEAINLDGGGSTTMVIAHRRSDSTAFDVVNRPSDAQGERAVGNALAVVGDPRCNRTTGK